MRTILETKLGLEPRKMTWFVFRKPVLSKTTRFVFCDSA